MRQARRANRYSIPDGSSIRRLYFAPSESLVYPAASPRGRGLTPAPAEDVVERERPGQAVVGSPLPQPRLLLRTPRNAAALPGRATDGPFSDDGLDIASVLVRWSSEGVALCSIITPVVKKG